MYYQKEIEEIAKEFDTSLEFGLTLAKFEERLGQYGKNVIARVKKKPLALRFLLYFLDIFALLLFGAAAISFFFGGETGPRDALVILGIVIANSTIGFIQEYKAEKIVEALKKILPHKAMVLRGGKEIEVMAEDVVPGDIILLDEGDDVPADGRIVESSNFSTNDFTLTGESVPQEKYSKVITKKVALTDIDNMVFAGTSVAVGVAKVLVTSTGINTEFGKIAQQTQTIEDEESPLQKELTKSAKTVSKITLLIGLAIFLLNLLLQKPFSDSLVFALSLAVAMVPEGLPATVSIALAFAVKKMAKQNALVKKLSAVETLGSATVICSDKTGTITKNEMTVKEMWVSGQDIHVKGIGYNPTGDFTLNNKTVKFETPEEASLFKACLFCNNAQLVEPQTDREIWSILGDPTEAALLTLAGKHGLKKIEEEKKIRDILEVPFSSDRKKMSKVIKEKDSGRIISYSKGAPDKIMESCSSILLSGKKQSLAENKEAVLSKIDEFAKKGLRVLALAQKEYLKGEEPSQDNAETDMIFLGLVGMIDPPKEGVAESVSLAKKAGIKVFMITGDYGLTAATIAERVGMVDKNYAILTGLDLLKMSDDKIGKLLKTQDVIFSRTAPDQKIRIVDILRKQGEIVAVTGDGVNDAPALRKADIGVAMGIAGTDVSKEASDIILLDDNFRTIVSAIREGRVVYANLKKFVHYIFSSNVGELFAVITGLALGLPTTIAAIQILAVDLGTDVLPSLALAVDPESRNVMDMPPRDQKERLLSRRTIGNFFFVGVVMGIGAAFAFCAYLLLNGWSWGRELPPFVYLGATTVTYSSLVFSQIANVFSTHAGRSSIIKSFFSNLYLVGASMISLFMLISFMNLSVLSEFLEMYPIGLTGLILAMAVGFVSLLFIKVRNLSGRYLTE